MRYSHSLNPCAFHSKYDDNKYHLEKNVGSAHPYGLKTPPHLKRILKATPRQGDENSLLFIDNPVGAGFSYTAGKGCPPPPHQPPSLRVCEPHVWGYNPVQSFSGHLGIQLRVS